MRVADTAILQASWRDACEVSAFAIKTYTEAFGAGFGPDDLRRHLDSRLSVTQWRGYLARDCVLLARNAGELVGYVQFGERAAAAEEMEIRRLYVDRPWQGMGLGTRLLVHALEDTRVAAAPVVHMEVWDENLPARRLYERFGFAAVGQKPFVLPSGTLAGYDTLMVRRQPLRPRPRTG